MIRATGEITARRGASQREAFERDVIEGLSRPRMRIPCKYFYDERGSDLFDQICELDEYYLTRAEQEILRQHAGQIAELVGPDCALIEFGSGSSVKTRWLLEALRNPRAYVPVDISHQHLMRSAARLAQQYPRIDVHPVWADYTDELTIPAIAEQAARRVIFFPGSTIGNFEPEEAGRFLGSCRALCGRDGALLIGVDLKKDPQVLHRAYNDAGGVTARFNLNMLARINRELGGNLRLDRFAHYAFYNPVKGRIEMHLVSLARQQAIIAGRRFEFDDGQSIFTESSYKYTSAQFVALASSAGWRAQQSWSDGRQLFSLHFMSD